MAWACDGCVTEMGTAGQRRGWGRFSETTQIYEGTNQIQRVVMARQLLKG